MAPTPNMLGLREAALRIRESSLTSQALVEACLDRIAEREDGVGAWLGVDRERALAAARAADAAPPSGPLHGVPIGIKDIIDTHDMPTGLGFAPYAERHPAWDAACVALCRRAGAIVLGKTVTTEFAYFAPGKTRNPHDLARTPGGSSSGSAAAVADFMVPAAFGSQTAASLTRPAAFCGVVGYKGSHGDYSLSGIRPLAESFDSLGVLTRTAADLTVLRDVLLDRAATRIEPFKAAPSLGFCRSFHWDIMDGEARRITQTAIGALELAGARVEEIALPRSMSGLVDDHRLVMAYEAARNYAFEADMLGDAISPAFAELCALGAALSRTDYRAARWRIAEASETFRSLFFGYDAWLAPSALGAAPLATQGTGDPIMSRMWTALRGPSINLPVGVTREGMPIGLQLVGPVDSDDALIRTACWAEQHVSVQAALDGAVAGSI